MAAVADPHEAAEADRLGGPASYRMRLANALLGAVQTETILTETAEVTDEQRVAAHGQQLTTAGVEDDPAKLMEFLRWQVLRAAGPLREIAHRPETGPIPLAAAHAAEALQQLLGVIATGQGPTTADAEALPRDLRSARESLVNAVENVDILLRMLDFAAGLAGDT